MELVKPCVDDPDRYTVHGELGVEVDLERVAPELPGDAKCLPEMGVARFELDGREITLYRDGGFDSRGVRDEEDARALAERLLSLIDE